MRSGFHTPEEVIVKTRTLVALAVLLMLMAGPAFAQKVYVDYDKNYDFASIRTFQWVDEPDSLEKSEPLLHSRIKNGIEHYLTQAGITQVTSDPSILVTYHTSTKENMSLNTTSFGYGYPVGWYGGYYGAYGYGAGIGTTTTTVSTYQTGTLVIDAWDAKTDKLVWRGVAANITVSDNPEKMQYMLDRALSKIVKKWQKMRKRGK